MRGAFFFLFQRFSWEGFLIDGKVTEWSKVLPAKEVC